MGKYIYLDRENAKKGIALVFAVKDHPVNDYQTYFGGKAIEFVGDDLPHYITYVQDGDKEYVREATRIELYERGIISLPANETVLDGTIVKKTRERLIADGIITLESELSKARFDRKSHLEAVDLYDKAVLRGDVQETEMQKSIRDAYRNNWLTITDRYTDINVPIEEMYPLMPDFIAYFYF